MSDILERVGKLLNQADSVDGPEREAFLNMANGLMFKHRIDEATARRTIDGGTARTSGKPIKFDIPFVGSINDFYDIHISVVMSFAELTGVQLVLEAGGSSLAVFGYEDDCRYFQMLWTSAHLTFSTKLFPKWDGTQTAGDNIKAMAEAGFAWKRIWEMGRSAGALGAVPEPPADNGKMKRLYAKACKEQGVERAPLTQRNAAYRDSYAVGFKNTIRQRVQTMVWDQSKMMAERGSGAELVLKKDADAIALLIEETYPGGLTAGSGRSFRDRQQESRGMAMGAAAGRAVDMTNGGRGVGGQGNRAEIGR